MEITVNLFWTKLIMFSFMKTIISKTWEQKKKKKL